MQTVKVKREDLLAVVKGNREKHRGMFEKAQTVYRQAVVEELDQMLMEARKGRRIRRSVLLPEPEDHTRDYDRVISMLEMSVEDTIELRQDEFSRYAMDQWEWLVSFTSNTLSYAAMADAGD